MKERVEKVRAYATVMADKYLFARQKVAIMEPLLSEEITKLFGVCAECRPTKLSAFLYGIRSCDLIVDDDSLRSGNHA